MTKELKIVGYCLPYSVETPASTKDKRPDPFLTAVVGPESKRVERSGKPLVLLCCRNVDKRRKYFSPPS